MTTLVEVRCCCEPEKVLGHMEIPDQYLAYRKSVMFTPGLVFDKTASRPFSMELNWVYFGGHAHALCFKKPHAITLSDLHSIRGFHEADKEIVSERRYIPGIFGTRANAMLVDEVGDF